MRNFHAADALSPFSYHFADFWHFRRFNFFTRFRTFSSRFRPLFYLIRVAHDLLKPPVCGLHSCAVRNGRNVDRKMCRTFFADFFSFSSTFAHCSCPNRVVNVFWKPFIICLFPSKSVRLPRNRNYAGDRPTVRVYIGTYMYIRV